MLFHRLSQKKVNENKTKTEQLFKKNEITSYMKYIHPTR